MISIQVDTLDSIVILVDRSLRPIYQHVWCLEVILSGENGSMEPENDIINCFCCLWELDNQKRAQVCLHCQASSLIFCSFLLFFERRRGGGRFRSRFLFSFPGSRMEVSNGCPLINLANQCQVPWVHSKSWFFRDTCCLFVAVNVYSSVLKQEEQRVRVEIQIHESFLKHHIR